MAKKTIVTGCKNELFHTSRTSKINYISSERNIFIQAYYSEKKQIKLKFLISRECICLDMHQLSKYSRHQYWKTGVHCHTAIFLFIPCCVGST